MELNVQLYDDGEILWDAFVATHQGSSNYHQYGWRNVIEKSFGHATYYLVARNCACEIIGILPLVYMESHFFGKFLISLPFFNYGGLLCHDNEIAESLLEKARGLLDSLHAEFVEFRHIETTLSGLESRQHKVSMVLDLEGDEELQWRALDAKVRNQVRKAEKSGLTATMGHLDLLDGFYEVFCRNMRDLGTPVYGKNFFQNILVAFPDTTRILSVMFEGRVVASGLLTWFKDTLEVPWASSISDYREKCPNNLLYWEAIRFAISNGSQKFDFGRSTPGEGTFRFKKQWGARPVPLSWQYLLESGRALPELSPKNPKYQAAIRVWQKLPVGLTRLLGPHIVRNIP